LFELVKTKDYFVITTNVESQFEKAGFERSKIFEVQGNYGWLQCSTACHDSLYDNRLIVAKMIMNINDCRIPPELVPKCPICNGNMDVNLRKDQFFVQDKNWHQSEKKYTEFIHRALSGKVVFLELGVGYNTPGIIRFPFESMVYQYKDAMLIRINLNDSAGYGENKNSTVAFDEDLPGVIVDLMQSKGTAHLGSEPK
jgi:NAD-dependent SIR2 family protein deacetylase